MNPILLRQIIYVKELWMVKNWSLIIGFWRTGGLQNMIPYFPFPNHIPRGSSGRFNFYYFIGPHFAIESATCGGNLRCCFSFISNQKYVAIRQRTNVVMCAIIRGWINKVPNDITSPIHFLHLTTNGSTWKRVSCSGHCSPQIASRHEITGVPGFRGSVVPCLHHIPIGIEEWRTRWVAYTVKGIVAPLLTVNFRGHNADHKKDE